MISAVIPEEDGSDDFGARYLQEFRRVNPEKQFSSMSQESNVEVIFTNVGHPIPCFHIPP